MSLDTRRDAETSLAALRVRMTEPGPSNAAPGGAANGASGDAHCDCAHCTAHYGLIRSSCPQCAQCQEDHRRLSATGGYAEGGYSNAKGGAGGQGGKGGKCATYLRFFHLQAKPTFDAKVVLTLLWTHSRPKPNLQPVS